MTRGAVVDYVCTQTAMECGERIGVRGDSAAEPDELAVGFFSAFGTTLKQRFAGWQVFLFSADFGLPRLLRLKEARKTPFFNGALECKLLRFTIEEKRNGFPA